MKTNIAAWKTLVAAVGLSMLLGGVAQAQTVVKPRPTPPDTWTLIGTTVANYTADHDSIIVKGRFDDFRQIMFKVTEAPLNMHHLVVTYDNGEPEEIRVRQKIPKGGQSRAIDLRGGTRSIRKIDFWYDTRGDKKERAEVTVFGKR
jgi:hypothetical protein